MTMIDGVFSLGRACYKQTLDAVRLWAVITLQSLWWEIGERSRSWNNVCSGIGEAGQGARAGVYCLLTLLYVFETS